MTTNALSLVLKASYVSNTGFGSDSSIFRTVAANEGQVRADDMPLAFDEELPFEIGNGYVLSQFILAGPRNGLVVDLGILRAPDPLTTIRLKAGGLITLTDPDIRSITVKNTSTTPARVNVLIARERTT